MKRWQLLAGAFVIASLIVVPMYWFWPRPRLNLLIITLDTTRADRLGCYGYKPGATPALDAMAAAGILFEHAYAPAPMTLPSHATMFTGLQPPEHGLRTNGKGRLGDSIPTVAEILKRERYETGAFVGAFVLDSKFGLDRGFKSYDDDLKGSDPKELEHRERDGQTVVDSALAWLKGVRERPFCCWVHLYDAHFPYLPHQDKFGEQFVKEPYDGEIAYLDLQVGRLLEYLKSAQLDQKTLVVIVGDHGEGLGDHEERRHGAFLYNSTLRVPLIMKCPNLIRTGLRVSENVSLVSLFPTILESLRIPGRMQTGGHSLLAAFSGGKIAGTPCYAATDEPLLGMGWSPLRSLTEARWKYIRTPRPELYDLLADPGEIHNLAESQAGEMQRMERLLAELESKMAPRDAAPLALTSKDRRVLESLGYAAGAGGTTAGAATEELRDMKGMLVYWNAVDDGLQLWEHGDLDAALKKLEFVTKGAPTAAMAQVYLGNVYDAKGNTAAAESAYRAALKHNPEFAAAHHYLGDLALRKRQLDKAAAEYAAALQSDPSMAEAHFKLGNILQQKGDLRAAHAHFEAAVENDPNYLAAHVNLGNLLLWEGRNLEAEEEYRTALKISPDSADAHQNLAAILSKTGRLREAEAELVETLRLRPNDQVLKDSLLRVREDLGRK